MGEALEGAERIGAHPLEPAPPFGWQRLGQYEIAEDDVGQRQRRRHEERRARIDVFGERPADRRAQREAETPRRADESEIARAVLVVADVTDVRAGGGV